MQDLWDRLDWLVDTVAGAQARKEQDGRTVRIPSAPGVVSFVSLEADPNAVLDRVWRLAVQTLVAMQTPPSDEDADFIDAANTSAFGGAWQRFSNGDVGVSGSFLVHDASAPSLATLLPQFLALQVRDACEVGRPPGGLPFDDADGVPLPVEQVWQRAVPIDELVELLRWRSAHHDPQRFVPAALSEHAAELIVPLFVGDTLSGADGVVARDEHRLTIARTDHPRRGAGTLLQVPLASMAQGDAAGYAISPWTHNLGRWHGTALGSVLAWADENTPAHLVYRTFVPDALLSVLRPREALDRLVDIALGTVNGAGAASIAVASLAAGEGPEAVEPSFRRDRRVARLRAFVPVQPRRDGLVDLSGPTIETGVALLDRLAVDQLQIGTAAHAVEPDGFTWLPTECSQQVTATPVQASRRFEVSVVRIATRLGQASPEVAPVVVHRCTELASQAAMSSLVYGNDDTVDLTSTIVVHEGVWWHRSSTVAVIAALHANLAGPLAAALAEVGLQPARHAGFEHIDLDAADTIIDVVPNLLDTHREHIPEPRRLIQSAIAALRLREGARQLEGDPGWDMILPLRVLSPAGGFDPELGEVCVFLDPFDHPQAGPSIHVMAHPGFPPALPDDQLAGVAARLTRQAHRSPVGAFAPTWQVHRGNLVATMSVPCIALAQLNAGNTDFPSQTNLLLQTIDATVAAVADAVERHPKLLPGFDRVQLNLRDGHATPAVGHLDGFASWAPRANTRCLAVRMEAGTPERWASTTLHLDGASAFIAWLRTGPRDRFLVDGVPLVAANRAGQGITLWLPHGVERQVPLDELPLLAAMLRHPEAPAIGTSEGPIVVAPLDVSAHDDTLFLVLPPAPAVTAVFSRDTSCDGATAATGDALWLRFRSPAGTVQVELTADLVEVMLQAAGEARSIPVAACFPPLDPRVTTSLPPDPTHAELSTRQLQHALDQRPR